MEEKHFVNKKAAKTGCIVFIFTLPTIMCWGWFLWPMPVYLVSFTLPASVIGALTGRYFVKTQVGSWFGAVFGTILGLWFSYLILPNMFNIKLNFIQFLTPFLPWFAFPID